MRVKKQEKSRRPRVTKSEAFLRVARFIKSLICSLVNLKMSRSCQNEKNYTLYKFCIKRSAGTVCFK